MKIKINHQKPYNNHIYCILSHWYKIPKSFIRDNHEYSKLVLLKVNYFFLLPKLHFFNYFLHV